MSDCLSRGTLHGSPLLVPFKDDVHRGNAWTPDAVRVIHDQSDRLTSLEPKVEGTSVAAERVREPDPRSRVDSIADKYDESQVVVTRRICQHTEPQAEQPTAGRKLSSVAVRVEDDGAGGRHMRTARDRDSFLAGTRPRLQRVEVGGAIVRIVVEILVVHWRTRIQIALFHGLAGLTRTAQSLDHLGSQLEGRPGRGTSSLGEVRASGPRRRRGSRAHESGSGEAVRPSRRQCIRHHDRLFDSLARLGPDGDERRLGARQPRGERLARQDRPYDRFRGGSLVLRIHLRFPHSDITEAVQFDREPGVVEARVQRSQLVETRAANERKESETRGVSLQAILTPVRDVDWRVLLALQGDVQAGTLISSAFDQLAQKADRIGQLNITPDLLQSLLPKPSSDGGKGKSQTGR